MYKETLGGGQMSGRDVVDTVKRVAESLGIEYTSRRMQKTSLGDHMPNEEIGLRRKGSKARVVVDHDGVYSNVSQLLRTSKDYESFKDLAQALQNIDMSRQTDGRYALEENNIARCYTGSVKSQKPRQRLRQSSQSVPSYSGAEVVRNIESYAKDMGCNVRVSRGYAGSPKDSNMYTEVSIIDPDKKGFFKSGIVGTALIWLSQNYDKLSGHVNPKGESAKYAKLETALKEMDMERSSVSETYNNSEKKVVDFLNMKAMSPAGNLETTLYK